MSKYFKPWWHEDLGRDIFDWLVIVPLLFIPAIFLVVIGICIKVLSAGTFQIEPFVDDCMVWFGRKVITRWFE